MTTRVNRAALLKRGLLGDMGAPRPRLLVVLGVITAKVVLCTATATAAAPADTVATPSMPPSIPNVTAILERLFTQYDPGYAAHVAQWSQPVDALSSKLIALEGQDVDLLCTEQQYIEAKALLKFSANWTGLSAELKRADASMAANATTASQAYAGLQDEDGSWGPCYTRFSQHFDAAVTAIGTNAAVPSPPDLTYPLAFMSRVATVDGMRAYMDSIKTSDVARTGYSQRDDMGAISAGLSQLVFKSYLRDYLAQHAKGFTVTPEYKDAYEAYLDAWQDPVTGYWGEWFVDGDDVVKSPDLSFTFHTVSYRKGNVSYWPQLVDTTLALKALPYPYGWLHYGPSGWTQETHNAYDIAKILMYGRPHMTPVQQAQTEAEVGEMLQWCLDDAMGPDGSFACDPTFYNGLGDCYYFGVSFLDIVGYFTSASSPPWWTNETFPAGPQLCHTIANKIHELKLTGDSAMGALQRLNADCNATLTAP